MDMPKISQCEVENCAYNIDQMCHALAITVGDGVHPHCDTYCQSSQKGGDMSCVGCVGACKVNACSFNSRLECQAREIRVGYLQGEIDCLTFQAG